MTHLELKINGNKPRVIGIEMPSTWNELTERQLLYIAGRWEIWQAMAKADMSLQKAKALLFVVLVRNKSNRQLREIVNLLELIDHKNSGMNVLSPVDFVFEKMDLHVNLLKKVEIHPFKTFYGPENKLGNLCIHEFSFAFHYYTLYNNTKDIKYLDLLMAVLYRPKQKEWQHTGDIRCPFNIYLVEEYSRSIAKLPEEYKQAVLLYFIGCLEHLAKNFPHIFRRSETTTSQKTSSFLEIILHISGDKFGTFDETKDQNMYLVMTEINNILEPKKSK